MEGNVAVPFKCPACSRVILAPGGFAGKVKHCPACRESVVVPQITHSKILKRRKIRCPLNASVTVKKMRFSADDPPTSFVATTTDISENGVYLVTENELYPDQPVELIFDEPDLGRVTLFGRVVHKREKPAPGLAVEFYRVDADDIYKVYSHAFKKAKDKNSIPT